jgi:hypothetical protein
VVIGDSEALKLSANHEESRPQGDLNQVRRESKGYHQRNDAKVDPETYARAAEFFFAAKEIYRPIDSQSVDTDRTHSGACANR